MTGPWEDIEIMLITSTALERAQEVVLLAHEDRDEATVTIGRLLLVLQVAARKLREAGDEGFADFIGRTWHGEAVGGS